MRITLPSGTPAERVAPDGAERGLVVIPDIMGLRPLFDDHVARLAAETGWTVVAPEIFPGHEAQPVEWRLEHAAEISDSRRLDDLVAAADATGCATVGVLGFCMGGMLAYKAAGTGRFHRAVGFYGMVHTPDNWETADSVDPLESVAAPGACPVMGIVGSADHWTPPDHVAELQATGAAVVIYEGADHGFVHDPSRPAHRADEAADAWSRALAFLAE